MTCSDNKTLGKRLTGVVAGAMLLAGSLSAGAAVTIGQIEDFEDGTTGNWGTGQPSPLQPQNIGSGGPAGLDDNYLLARSRGGAGAGSRLVLINEVDFTGNLTGAGVTAINMDVNNLGATALSLRLFVESIQGNAVSTNAIELPSGSGWQSVAFSLLAADLSSTSPLGPVLAAVSQIRLFHNSTAVFPGGPITASLGIDNVSAVPEPGAKWLTAGGLCLLGAYAMARRRQAAKPAATPRH
jgi:hypothetical protein